MKLFQKPVVAILCMVLMIVTSTGVQAYLGLNKEITSLESFFLNDEGDGFSIQASLESKMEFSNELANKFAIQYLKSNDSFIQAVSRAISNLQNASSMSDKYAASFALDTANNQLIGVLLENVDEKGLKELNRLSANLTNCNDQISHSTYNDLVDNLQKKLDQFPAELWMKFFNLQLPDHYRA